MLFFLISSLLPKYFAGQASGCPAQIPGAALHAHSEDPRITGALRSVCRSRFDILDIAKVKRERGKTQTSKQPVPKKGLVLENGSKIRELFLLLKGRQIPWKYKFFWMVKKRKGVNDEPPISWKRPCPTAKMCVSVWGNATSPAT